MQNISKKIAFSTLMALPMVLFSDPFTTHIDIHQFLNHKERVVTEVQNSTRYFYRNFFHRTPRSYSRFKSGIITPKRLTKYIDNWSKYKPRGVEGRLVIIQAGATSDGRFLKSNGRDVVTYQIPAGGSCDPSYVRHDGFSNVPGAMITGEKMDGMINMFHLDPKKDFVLFAVGEGSTGMREVVRSAWSLVYWGWNKDRLAILNGSVDYDFSEHSGLDRYLVDTPDTPPAVPSNFTMKSLNKDRTDRHIYIDKMMKIASNRRQRGYFIADARGTDEYNGLIKSKTADITCGPNHDEQCYSPFQGHIRGAVDFPYTDLLVLNDQESDVNGDGKVDKNDASFRFKSPKMLKRLYRKKGYRRGDKVITYCRTGRKATLISYTSEMILNYDVAMYDGSWIQWGEMANRTDVNGSTILPQGSRWITDSSKYSVNLGYTDPIYTQSKQPYAINESSQSSKEIQREDRRYLSK